MNTLRLLLCLCCMTCVWGLEAEQTCFARPELSPAFSQLRFISVPLAKAYPGTEYNIRPAVIGGTWPYRFKLLLAPAGMTIDPSKGTISWLAPEINGPDDGQAAERSQTVKIHVQDRAGLQAEQEFRITVTKTGFYFVSPNGDDAHAGNFEKPWKTLQRAKEAVQNPAQATLYLRGGHYVVDSPAAAGKKNAHVLAIGRESARHWIAWPGEQPVIDMGWSESKWKAALAYEKGRLDRGETTIVTTKGYGHRIYIDHQIDGFLFDGIEVKNAAYYMFVMWDGNRRNLTWRRCHFHHLYGDYYENSSFIFTFAAERKWKAAAEGERFPFGQPPEMKPYENMVVQDCHFSDRPYTSQREGGWHGGGIVWYTTKGCLIEDSRFERIERGMALMDKDCGLENTYRNNVILGSVMFAAQGCNEHINLHHNFIHGDLSVGAQPGWMRNIWLHHNAIKGKISLMGGATDGPQGFNPDGKTLAGPTDPESQAMIRDYPHDKKLVHAYANVVADSNPNAKRDAHTIGRFNDKKGFAKKYRFVSWDHNLVDAALDLALGWSGKRMEWSEMKKCGFDVHGATGTVLVDDEGHLPEDSAWRADYGRDAGLE